LSSYKDFVKYQDQGEEGLTPTPPCVRRWLRLTLYVYYKRLLQLMEIFRSVSDSTRELALC